MIEENTKAFDGVKKFLCEFNSEYFLKFKGKLCLESNQEEKDIVQRATIKLVTNLYNKFEAYEIAYKEERFLVTKGLCEFELSSKDLELLEFSESNSGIFLLMLSDGYIKPISIEESLYNLFDQYLFDDGSDDVRRIDFNDLSYYFESFQIFKIKTTELDAQRIFGYLVLKSQDKYINTHIERELLESIFLNGSDRLPFDRIIKSLLHHDEPKQFFLELYRSIERVFSFPTVEKLSRNLKRNFNLTEETIDHWKLAEVLEDSTGWRQNELNGLANLLKKLSETQIDSCLTYLSEAAFDEKADDFKNDKKMIEIFDKGTKERDAKEKELHNKKADFVAKKIYRVRNAFVHYREVHVAECIEDAKIPFMCNLVGFILDPIYTNIESQLNS